MDYLFSKTLSEILAHSVVFPGRPLRCMVVANPTAGGFYIKSKWASHIRILNKYVEKAKANPGRQLHKNIIINLTQGKGSAKEITNAFINMIEKDQNPFYLIISAGGDGTHSEVMFSIYNAPAHVRSNVAILRLPMGTGNDGADATTLEGALDLLLSPSRIEYAPAVQLVLADDGPAKSKGPFLAFNILSVGLDAYVTHKTNSMKGKVAGNTYKFWIDMAALFYEKKFKVDFMDVRAFDVDNNELLSFNEKLLLLAMGVSGHRTYGSQQKILSDHRNVCAVKKMSLLNKLKIKGQVTKGKHTENPNAIMLNAHRLEFSGKHPILAQMDGETVLLQPEDFPAKMELTSPVIPLLKMG
ncbi:MAG: diacylglycerol kinase [Treponema sp.]|jgi:diacylglycerol kinase family enzyme|nr:diacylglycerol kinase [Treponema sp.]